VHYMDKAEGMNTTSRPNKTSLSWPPLGVWLVPLILAGCGLVPGTAVVTKPSPPPVPVPVKPPAQVKPAPAAPPVAVAPTPRARNWAEYREQAARRMVQMNPGKTYMTTAPNPLMAIPVLEVELNDDGSVAGVRVERTPRQEPQTVQMAIDAVRRAAPYGSVAHLPKPWKFTEVFLYDWDFRFKPRTLD
jgi:hypothetical protein